MAQINLEQINSLNNLNSLDIPQELKDWLAATIDILNTNLNAIATVIETL